VGQPKESVRTRLEDFGVLASQDIDLNYLNIQMFTEDVLVSTLQTYK
jgi:hypothetical protein